MNVGDVVYYENNKGKLKKGKIIKIRTEDDKILDYEILYAEHSDRQYTDKNVRRYSMFETFEDMVMSILSYLNESVRDL